MKLNYLYCLLAFLFMPLCIKAQDVKYLKYQGEVNTSFSFSIDEETSNLRNCFEMNQKFCYGTYK